LSHQLIDVDIGTRRWENKNIWFEFK